MSQAVPGDSGRTATRDRLPSRHGLHKPAYGMKSQVKVYNHPPESSGCIIIITMIGSTHK